MPPPPAPPLPIGASLVVVNSYSLVSMGWGGPQLNLSSGTVGTARAQQSLSASLTRPPRTPVQLVCYTADGAAYVCLARADLPEGALAPTSSASSSEFSAQNVLAYSVLFPCTGGGLATCSDSSELAVPLFLGDSFEMQTAAPPPSSPASPPPSPTALPPPPPLPMSPRAALPPPTPPQPVMHPLPPFPRPALTPPFIATPPPPPHTASPPSPRRISRMPPPPPAGQTPPPSDAATLLRENKVAAALVGCAAAVVMVLSLWTVWTRGGGTSGRPHIDSEVRNARCNARRTLCRSLGHRHQSMATLSWPEMEPAPARPAHPHLPQETPDDPPHPPPPLLTSLPVSQPLIPGWHLAPRRHSSDASRMESRLRRLQSQSLSSGEEGGAGSHAWAMSGSMNPLYWLATQRCEVGEGGGAAGGRQRSLSLTDQRTQPPSRGELVLRVGQQQ